MHIRSTQLGWLVRRTFGTGWHRVGEPNTSIGIVAEE